MPELLEAALGYARRGWPVFPCRADKAPYTPRGVLDATTSERQVRAWWSEFPRANIGLDVGGAGMVVLDFDPGSDIEEVRRVLESNLETELLSRTPRGGSHRFYQLARNEVVPPSASKVAPHVDVRSFHSYVLLPPSRTRDGAYEWESEGRPSHRPGPLLQLSEATAKSEDRDEWVIEPDLPENVEEATRYLIDEARIAIEGAGGDDMAYRTAAMCKSYGLSPETASDLMWQHWNPRCLPPWGADEAEHLERKVRNAYAYNTSPPGNLTQAYRVARTQRLFAPVSRDTQGGGRETQAGRFRFVDELGVESIRPPEWLIAGCIPRGGYAMLVGPRSTYKTFLALDMALTVACGGAAWFEEGDWLGPWAEARQGPVLYVAGEGRAGFRSRVAAWRSMHVDGDATEAFYLADPVPHPTEEDVTAFVEGAKALSVDGFELVVIDTVGRSMQGLNENSQQDASRFTFMVQTIQAELGSAVLAVHHTGHEASDRARGSSVFGADVDAEFVTERWEQRVVRVRNPKQKDAPEWEDALLIELREYENSLVAVAPDRRQMRLPLSERPEESKERGRGGGRRAAGEREVELAHVRKVAYQIMRRYPGKEWSRNALAQAVAADESVSVAAGTVRNRYLDELTTDKAHPVAGCFDQGKGVWIYKPKGKDNASDG